MKSGTNGFTVPRITWAATRYSTRLPSNHAGQNLTRQHVWGVTQDNPIKRNKLFNFSLMRASEQ